MAKHDYFSKAYPEPWQILGVKLLPFSFGHYLKLHRLECAFVAEDTQSATLADLLLGVVVCSMRSDPDPEKDPFWIWLHRECPRGLSGLWWRLLNGRKTPAQADMVRWGKTVGTFDINGKAKLFAEYIETHKELPAYVEEPSDSPPRESGAHWAQAVINALVSKCGYTLDEAYNAPMPKCWADFFGQAEASGSIRLVPDELAEALG